MLVCNFKEVDLVAKKQIISVLIDLRLKYDWIFITQISCYFHLAYFSNPYSLNRSFVNYFFDLKRLFLMLGYLSFHILRNLRSLKNFWRYILWGHNLWESHYFGWIVFWLILNLSYFHYELLAGSHIDAIWKLLHFFFRHTTLLPFLYVHLIYSNIITFITVQYRYKIVIL